MAETDHPNILNMYDRLEDTHNLYIITKECVGGDLFEHVIKAGHFSESKACGVLEQVVRAVKYLHG